MVKTSGIREKLRSNVLNNLAKERTNKRQKTGNKTEKVEYRNDLEEDHFDLNRARSDAGRKIATSSLLSILPKPKNDSSFGPTISLDHLLQIEPPEKDIIEEPESPVARLTNDGMIEVDVSKEMSDVSVNAVRELTLESTGSGNIVIPKGKEKQKNQITYLARLGKATELEQKEKAAQGRANKAAARSKYGW